MRQRQKKIRKVKGGAYGSCMMPQAQPVQSGGKCPCAAASKLLYSIIYLEYFIIVSYYK